MTPPEPQARPACPRVLLAEPDAGDAELVQIWLRRAYEVRFDVWHVETLSDAQGCLAKASFELALVDLSLPDATGPWAFHALHERYPDLPIIVFTSFAEAEAGRRLLDEGAHDHLVKGQMSGDVLIRSMRHGVERGRLARELREARGQTRDVEHMRSELVAELGQELRTPLHTVLGMADLLLETRLSPEQQGYVHSFLRASEALLDRIDGLLGVGAATPDAGATSGDGATAARAASPPASLRVLVVADDVETREYLVSELRGAGHTTDAAADGRVALEMFREGDYDLVFLDMQMPERDGFEAIRAIRRAEAESGRASLPVLAVTSPTRPADVSACLEAGCDGHLAKPVTGDALREALRRHAPKHHGRLLRVDGATAEEIDRYLHDRHNDLAGLRYALDADDLDAVRAVGHELERSALGRGFVELAGLGGDLQAAVAAADRRAVERVVAELSDFLREVKIVVG